jgi:hypothetical protein
VVIAAEASAAVVFLERRISMWRIPLTGRIRHAVCLIHSSNCWRRLSQLHGRPIYDNL